MLMLLFLLLFIYINLFAFIYLNAHKYLWYIHISYVLNTYIAAWRIARLLRVVGGNVGNLVVVNAVKKSIRRKYLYFV